MPRVAERLSVVFWTRATWSRRRNPSCTPCAWRWTSLPRKCQPRLGHAELIRRREADFAVGRWRYSVYGHDWRAMPPAAWLTLLGEREVGAGRQAAAGEPPAAPMIVLSRPDFAAAVREALRDFVRLTCRATIRCCGARGWCWRRPAATGPGRPPILSLCCRCSCAGPAKALQASPRALKLYRALYHTCFQPAPRNSKYGRAGRLE